MANNRACPVATPEVDVYAGKIGLVLRREG